MTTNVIDLAAKLVGSDSRWSFKQGNLLHYVDDTSFDKIVVAGDVIMVCAGDAGLIGQWSEWVNKPDFYDLPTPPTEVERDGEESPVYVALITRPEGELIYCKGVYWLVDGTFMFTGTGGEHARSCYTANKNIEMCVETAKASDDFTGGTPRQVDVVTGKGNLADPAKGVDDILDSYKKRGFIMDLVTRAKQSVVQADTVAANEQAAQGKQMHFSAPTGPVSPWTQEDHVRLGKALQQLSDRANKRTGK